MLNRLINIALALFGADVITVTSGTQNTLGSTAAELITYMYAKLLEVAERNTILKQFGEKAPLPAGQSKTIRFVRMEKFSPSTPSSQLTEGIPPEATGLTLQQFEATMEQYGYLVRISELAELTARHPIIQRAIYLLGLHAAEVYDQLVFAVLDANTTSVYRPNARGADTSLLATDQLGYVDLVQLNANLMDNAARALQGGRYVLVVAPQVHASLQRDPDWKASHQLAQPEAIWNGQVGVLSNFDVVVSNSPALAYSAQTTSGYANKVFSSFGIGNFAYQVSDLQNLQLSVVPPGGHSDPLKQSYLLGWKFAFKTIITNATWIYRIRSAGSNSTAY